MNCIVSSKKPGVVASFSWSEQSHKHILSQLAKFVFENIRNFEYHLHSFAIMCRTPDAIKFIPCNCIFFENRPQYCEDFKKTNLCVDGSHPSIVIEGHQPRLEKCNYPKNPSLGLRYRYFDVDDGLLYERYDGHRIIYERNEHEYPWWKCQIEKKLEEVEIVERKCPFHEWVVEDEERDIEKMKKGEEQKEREKYERSFEGKLRRKVKRGIEVALTFESGW